MGWGDRERQSESLMKSCLIIVILPVSMLVIIYAILVLSRGYYDGEILCIEVFNGVTTTQIFVLKTFVIFVLLSIFWFFYYHRKSITVRIIFVFFVLLFAFWFFHLRHEKDEQMKRGDIMVEKIEEFRAIHGRLPTSLEEVGEEEIDVWYDIRSECDYSISYGISLDHNMSYYSDTKTWEVGFRLMRSEFDKLSQEPVDIYGGCEYRKFNP